MLHGTELFTVMYVLMSLELYFLNPKHFGGFKIFT